jgi:hypothetical protein
VDAGSITLTVVFAGPVGATLAAAGAGAVNGTALVRTVVIPPCWRRSSQAASPANDRGFRRGQIASASP